MLGYARDRRRGGRCGVERPTRPLYTIKPMSPSSMLSGFRFIWRCGSVVGDRWRLATAAVIFGIILFGATGGDVAAQQVRRLLLIANHGDQAVELVGSRGPNSVVYSIARAASQLYPTYSGVSWEIRRNGARLCGGVISLGVTHVRIDPPAAPAGWTGETIEGFNIRLSADLARNGGERDAARSFLQERLREALDLLPAWTHRDARATELWVGLDERNTSGAYFHHNPLGRQSPFVPFDHLHPSMWFGIVIPNIKAFRERLHPIHPLILVHEFAHAHHFRVLGNFQADIIRAYENAMANGLYKTVESSSPRLLLPDHAARNRYEYFAVLSEAYLGSRSPRFPFTRDQLKEYDPDGHDVVERAWAGTLREANGVVTVDCRAQ